ncbi:hypothetical protein SAMN05421640_3049 [Ekhidna lutea]|uniref:Uncharacterized protein n=1 Tax=Ekhidna lutea TaxID=447679 RepID=A0A239L9T2_EKHLU|nr:hypothetical protein SAMN05421640_3049 [Ekhidna lutea]
MVVGMSNPSECTLSLLLEAFYAFLFSLLAPYTSEWVGDPQVSLVPRLQGDTDLGVRFINLTDSLS